ncbi:hypothetical protein ACLOJK_039866 [Asimina triloba]
MSKSNVHEILVVVQGLKQDWMMSKDDEVGRKGCPARSITRAYSQSAKSNSRNGRVHEL